MILSLVLTSWWQNNYLMEHATLFYSSLYWQFLETNHQKHWGGGIMLHIWFLHSFIFSIEIEKVPTFCVCFLTTANTLCSLAISSTVSICLILIFQPQFCNYWQWMNRKMEIWIWKRLYNLSGEIPLCTSLLLCSYWINLTQWCRKFFLHFLILFRLKHEQIVKDQSEMAHANFSIIRKEAQSLLDLVGIHRWN